MTANTKRSPWFYLDPETSSPDFLLLCSQEGGVRKQLGRRVWQPESIHLWWNPTTCPFSEAHVQLSLETAFVQSLLM